MCIIAISDKGIRQPNDSEFREMFTSNPHGCGYMFARDGKVYVHKGFMNYKEFCKAVASEHFTDDDVVVYHFRISTQGGVNREMTQPFAFTNNIVKTKALDVRANIGIAHNGIIPLTTDHTDKEYSDTAHFIAEYLPNLFKKTADIHNPFLLDIIEEVIKSRMCFMDGYGLIETVGSGWITDDSGIIYSNSSYKAPKQFTFADVNPKYRYAFYK